MRHNKESLWLMLALLWPVRCNRAPLGGFCERFFLPDKRTEMNKETYSLLLFPVFPAFEWVIKGHEAGAVAPTMTRTVTLTVLTF